MAKIKIVHVHTMVVGMRFGIDCRPRWKRVEFNNVWLCVRVCTRYRLRSSPVGLDINHFSEELDIMVAHSLKILPHLFCLLPLSFPLTLSLYSYVIVLLLCTQSYSLTHHSTVSTQRPKKKTLFFNYSRLVL